VLKNGTSGRDPPLRGWKPSQKQQVTAEGKAHADEKAQGAAGCEHFSAACNAASALSDAFLR
jgi:hypothetical protein